MVILDSLGWHGLAPHPLRWQRTEPRGRPLWRCDPLLVCRTALSLLSHPQCGPPKAPVRSSRTCKWPWAGPPRGPIYARDPSWASRARTVPVQRAVVPDRAPCLVLPPLKQDESRRTRENAPPSRPSRSQRRCTTTLRSDLLSSPGHQPLRTVLDPPEAASQDKRVRKMWVSRGITPSLGWSAWDPRGTTPRPIVRGTAASAPPPPPPPQCLGALASANPAMHCLTTWGRRPVQLPQYTASLPGGSGQWNSCYTLPHCLGSVGSGTLQHTASPPGGGGQWNSCNTLSQCLRAVGS